MSMSTHVVGIIPGNNVHFQSFLKIYNECEFAGITPPQAVLDFFGNERPDPAGMIVNVPSKEYNNDMQQGLEVNLDELPSSVKIIRFVNCY